MYRLQPPAMPRCPRLRMKQASSSLPQSAHQPQQIASWIRRPQPASPFTNVSGNTWQATIPTYRFDKASLALLNYIPVAASNGTPFSYLQPNLQNYNEFIGRYDQELTAKDRLTMRYYLDKFHIDGVLDPNKLPSPPRMSPISRIKAHLCLKHMCSAISY